MKQQRKQYQSRHRLGFENAEQCHASEHLLLAPHLYPFDWQRDVGNGSSFKPSCHRLQKSE